MGHVRSLPPRASSAPSRANDLVRYFGPRTVQDGFRRSWRIGIHDASNGALGGGAARQVSPAGGRAVTHRKATGGLYHTPPPHGRLSYIFCD
jgi:hypothetical protein